MFSNTWKTVEKFMYQRFLRKQFNVLYEKKKNSFPM